MTEVLYVVWGEKTVGELRQFDDNLLEFQYDAGWLNADNRSPISAQMPLRGDVYADKNCRVFFANLLPEANTRTLIARRLGISESNDFALLKALGADCAGALSLWPTESPEPRAASYAPLSIEQLEGWMDQMESTSLLSPSAELRLSLAGVQQKIPLRIDGDRFFIPQGSAASSHIFKPDIPAFPGSAMNEAFCMTLAKRVGLPVPDVRLWRGKRAALIVSRYDRRFENDQWARIHQEDFCQALGYSYSRKYESEGGPGFTKAFQLLDSTSTQPIVDKDILIGGIIFNACIGNMDAHGKNFSALIENRTYRLAPFYDLLSTRVYGSLSPKMAMKIGGQVRAEWLTRSHWEALAREAGVRPKAVLTKVEEFIQKMPDTCGEVLKSFEPLSHEREILDRIVAHIQMICMKIKHNLAGPVA